jgi:hypothetical protein
VAIDGSGRIVAGGGDVQNSGEHALFVRLSPRGTPDSGFGSTGVITLRSTHASNRGDIVRCCVKSIAIAGRGEIVGAGDYMDGTVGRAALWAITATGRLDSSVGRGGLVKLAFRTNLGGESQAITVARDGSIYSGGATLNLRPGRGGTALVSTGSFVARYRGIGLGRTGRR